MSEVSKRSVDSTIAAAFISGLAVIVAAIIAASSQWQGSTPPDITGIERSLNALDAKVSSLSYVEGVGNESTGEVVQDTGVHREFVTQEYSARRALIQFEINARRAMYAREQAAYVRERARRDSLMRPIWEFFGRV